MEISTSGAQCLQGYSLTCKQVPTQISATRSKFSDRFDKEITHVWHTVQSVSGKALQTC